MRRINVIIWSRLRDLNPRPLPYHGNDGVSPCYAFFRRRTRVLILLSKYTLILHPLSIIVNRHKLKLSVLVGILSVNLYQRHVYK
jgi:hypothetical protein